MKDNNNFTIKEKSQFLLNFLSTIPDEDISKIQKNTLLNNIILSSDIETLKEMNFPKCDIEKILSWEENNDEDLKKLPLSEKLSKYGSVIKEINHEEISLEKKDSFFELFPKKSQGYDTVWRWGKEKAIDNMNINIAGKKMTDAGFQIVEKYRKTEKMARSVWWEKEDNSEKGTLHLKRLFNGKKVFNFPKSKEVIIKLLKMGMDSKDIILDFFAGSGTTADAVMQLNAEDGGNRKYILVQLPEKIDSKKNKTAYDFVKDELKVDAPTIFEITKERLIRAGAKIQEENQKSKEPQDLSNQDFGFKIFETVPIWEDYDFEADELNAQVTLFDESKLTEDDLKALLVTWKTNDGILLTESLQEIDLDDYLGYYASNKLYLVSRGFKTKNLKALLEKIDSDKKFNPTSIIAFGYNFESKNLREIAENIKSYANKKSIDIDFITRY